MSAPWLRPVDPAGYRTLSPESQARVAAQQAQASARRMREAFVGARQVHIRAEVQRGRAIAAEVLGGAR